MIPFSLRRNIERIRSSSAQVVMLIAPAGFGKTTIANALSADYESRHTVCDCSEAATSKQFFHAIIAALARELPSEEVWLSQVQLDLAGLETEDDRVRLLSQAWQKASENPSLFIFENCEAVLRDTGASALLRRLVSTAPSFRRVVVCSRTPLSIHAGRALPPHRMLLLTTKDLTLTDEESKSILKSGGISADHLEQIVALAHGWPVVLLLLKRLANEGKLEGALQNAYSIAFDDLFPYLYQEVLAPLPKELRRAATVCAAIPDLNSEELRLVLGQSTVTAMDLRNVPLLEVHNDRYTIHPFVRELLLTEEPQWRDLVGVVARAAEEAGRNARAAKLYRIGNDIESAARALANLGVDDLLAPEAALELASMPALAIREYPKLALTFLQHTRITKQLQVILDQAFDKALTTETPPVIASVAGAAIEAGHWLGSLQRARRIIDHPRIRKMLRKPEPGSESLVGVEQVCNVLSGAIESNIDALYEAYHQSLGLPLVYRSSILAAYLGYAERWRGHREKSLQLVEQSVAHALASRYPLIVIGTIAEAFANAWFWGDDALANRYRKLLATWREESIHDLRSFPLFNSDDPEEAGGETLPSTAAPFPFLVAAADADYKRQEYYLHRAQMRAFADDGLLTTRVLTLLAQAASVGKDRDILQRALDLTDKDELPHLREAIIAQMKNSESFLSPFMRRFMPVQTAAAPAPEPARERTMVSVLNESVEIGGNRLTVSPREAACLACLARQHSGIAREELQEAIWPDLSETAARDALYDLLYRLRKRAGDFELIENIGNAYRFSNRILVDLWEIENAAQRSRRGMPPPIEEVERAFDMIERRSWPHLTQFDWFPALEFRIKEAGRTLVRHLIETALRSQAYSAVLDYAHKLLQEDECDEWAHEMIIRAYLGLGNRIEAIRAYRNYVQLVKREVGSLPSSDLQDFAERHSLTESRAAS